MGYFDKDELVSEAKVFEIINGMPRESTLYFYACGHCSAQIQLRPDRNRERVKCLPCGRYICEKSAICREQCTPLYAMSYDHFENAGVHGKYVPAIMQGITSVKEAEDKGLVSLT